MENVKFEKLVAEAEKLLSKAQKLNSKEDITNAQADKLSYIAGELERALSGFNQYEAE